MGQPSEGFEYFADFLSADEQATLQRELELLHYEHQKFRGQTIKRGYAQFGYGYLSTGRKVVTAPAMPEFVSAVIEKAKLHCPAGTEFNQCIVSHYPPGAGIGWHTDKPVFGECVVGVSIGADARLQFRPNGAQKVSLEVGLAPGSMYVMRGTARWEYQHQIVPVKRERLSLTFRHVPEG